MLRRFGALLCEGSCVRCGVNSRTDSFSSGTELQIYRYRPGADIRLVLTFRFRPTPVLFLNRAAFTERLERLAPRGELIRTFGVKAG